MDVLTIERSFDSQATWVIDVLGSLLDTLSMGVCTTSTGRRPFDWCRNQMSALQKLNVCTIKEMRELFSYVDTLFNSPRPGPKLI